MYRKASPAIVHKHQRMAHIPILILPLFITAFDGSCKFKGVGGCELMERVPAAPLERSRVSTLKPLSAAQRVYMRSSISAQSMASVPPAPACRAQGIARF